MKINEKENRIRIHICVVFMKIEHVLLLTQGVPVPLFLVSFAFLLPFEHEISLTYSIHKESFRYDNSVIYFSDKGVCCYSV